ncbi:MAG: hypothetical protein AABN95_11600 [Acidobacteriota bacterium]
MKREDFSLSVESEIGLSELGGTQHQSAAQFQTLPGDCVLWSYFVDGQKLLNYILPQ